MHLLECLQLVTNALVIQRCFSRLENDVFLGKTQSACAHTISHKGVCCTMVHVVAQLMFLCFKDHITWRILRLINKIISDNETSSRSQKFYFFVAGLIIAWKEVIATHHWSFVCNVITSSGEGSQQLHVSAVWINFRHVIVVAS